MTAKPAAIDFQWVLRGSKALRTSSGSGRDKKFRVCDDRARAANFEVGAFADLKEVDKREEVPFRVARRVAAAAENMFRFFPSFSINVSNEIPFGGSLKLQ